MQSFLLRLALILLPVSAFSQAPDTVFLKKLTDEIMNRSQAYQNLRDLTKNIGGRLSGSPQMVAAEKWGLQRMQIAGADKAWMQECLVPHWVRGGKDECIVELPVTGTNNMKTTPYAMDVIALGNSMGSGPQGIHARILEVKSFADLDAKKEEVKGKIVFYNYPFNNAFINTFESYGDAVKYRGGGPSAAAKYGAVAVIVRSMTHSVDNNPHTGSTRYDTAYAKIPAIAVGVRDADMLSKTLRDAFVNGTIKTYGHFLPDTTGHNIIGELTGSEFPDQYITVGGHLDSWDPAEGAHDDGAGVVQTIEILRAFKAMGFKPRHTIRFVLFANEENGLRGGTKYAEEAKTKGEKHLFALESDAGGFSPRGFGLDMEDAQVAKVKQWTPLLAPLGANQLEKGGDGSDIGPLKRTFNIPTAGLMPDSQRYFEYHHARNDVFENVNKRELELGALNMAALLYLIDKYGL